MVALTATVDRNVTPTVDKVLVAPKAMVIEWTRRRTQQRNEIQNVADRYFSQFSGPTYVGE